MRPCRAILGALLLLASLVASAQVNNYYVSTTGSDTTGNGTSGNPYKTLAKAESVLVVGAGGPSGVCAAPSGYFSAPGYGACIHVLAGSYPATALTAPYAPTATATCFADVNPLHICSSKSGTATARIGYLSETYKGAQLNGGIWTRGDYTDVIGFDHTCPNCDAAVWFGFGANTSGTSNVGHNNNVIFGYMHDVGQTYGTVPGQGNLVSIGCATSGAVFFAYAAVFGGVYRTVIDHVGLLPTDPGGQPCHEMHAIYMAGGGGRIIDNLLSRAAGNAVHLYHNACRDVVWGNTMFNDYSNGGDLSAGSSGDGTGDLLNCGGANQFTAYNTNLFVNNGNVTNANFQLSGNREYSDNPGHNNFFNEGLIGNRSYRGADNSIPNVSGSTNTEIPHPATDSCGGNIGAGGGTCIASSTTATTATCFVNYTGDRFGDMHLKAGCPFIAAGTNANCAASPGQSNCSDPLDFDGTARANPPSMGAYEFSGGGGAARVSPTTLGFGNQLADPGGASCTATQISTLSNTGTASITITSAFSFSDPNFAFGGAGTCSVGQTLAPSQSCLASVKFCPLTVGAKPGSLSLPTSAGVQTVSLTGTGTAPAVTLAPTNIPFGNQVIATTSPSQSATLTNSGTGALSITSITLIGTNPTDFSQTNTCPASLGVGASCSFTITFHPAATGAKSAAISIADNAPGSPQAITLSGTGVGTAQATLTASLIFSGQLVGTTSSSQPLTFANTGGVPLTISAITHSGDFTVSSSTCPAAPATLAVSTSCTISVTFTPTAPGSRTGSVVVTSNASSSPNTATLTGTGTQAALTLTPATLTFPPQNTGTTSAGQVITLSNPGTASTTLTSITLTGTNPSDYGQSTTCGGSLAAAASCTVTVTFTPTATGSRPALLTVVDSAPSSPHVATLAGTGIAPVVSLTPSSLAFGSQTTGMSTVAQALTLTNTGTGTLIISSIALTGTDLTQFTQTNTCGVTLGAGVSCAISVRFAPTTAGAKSASLTVTDSATGSPHSSTLSGTGVAAAPLVSLTPSTLTFPPQLIGVTSAGQNVTLQNVGTASLTISSIATSGDYSITNPCVSPLAINASCIITVRFTPTAAGTRTGTLTVTDSASGSPHTVALTGIGQQALAVPAPSSISFGSATVGFPTAPSTVTLSNPGSATLTGLVISLAGTDPGDYVLSNTGANRCQATLNAGGSCQVTVAFLPTTTGSRPATLQFVDSAASSPQSVTLSGTGVAAAPAVSLSSTSVNMGSQQVGATSPAQTVILTNSGTATLTIASVTPSGDYADTTSPVTNCGGSLAIGATCAISITFTPTATGTRSGAITITTNAATSPDVVTLTGQGTPVPVPVATLTPSSLTFTSQQTGTTSPAQNATLQNTGSANLLISSITLTGANPGDYIQSNGCISPLAPTSSCTIMVSFAPTLAGTRTATLTVNDNAAGSPHTVALSGTAFVGSPGISFNPTSVTFPATNLQVPSTAIPVTLTNPGTATLLISNIAVSGDYSQTNNCGGSVGASAFCTVNVIFTPLAPGTRLGTLTVTDNASGSPHTVPLSGTGTGAVASFSPASQTFPSTIQGQPSPAQVESLTNTGNVSMAVTSISFSGTNPGDFSQTNNCIPTLGVGATCHINLTFTPGGTGVRSATIIITDSSLTSPHSVPLSGTGLAAAPVVQLSPTTLNFGSIQSGSPTAAQVSTLTNVGTATLNISSITATGTNSADYGLTNGCGSTLAINASCTLSVIFTPGGLGTRVASLSVADDAVGSPQLVSMTGVGTAAPAPKVQLSTTSLTFPSQQVGTTSPSQVVTVTNSGDSSLSITSTLLGPPAGNDYFMISTCGATLASTASCTLTLTFTPTAAGTRNSVITLTDSASDSPQTVALSGTAFTGTPVATLSITSLSFIPQVVLTTSSPLTVALTNTGTANLALASVVASSDFAPGSNEFAQTNNCPASLIPQATCIVNVTFTPQLAGSRTGRITFTNNAAGSPQIVSLSGTGQNPPPPPGPMSAVGIGGHAGLGGQSGVGIH